MRKKLIALLLCFVMIASSGLFTNFVTAADESSQSSELEIILDESQGDTGMAFEEEDFQKFEINLEESNPFQSEEATSEQEEIPTLDFETDDVDDAESVNELDNDGINLPLEISIYEQFMACKSLEELDAVFAIISDEDWNNLTEEERAAITELLMELKQAPTSEVVLIESEPAVQSEIVIPIVDFTNVAPFKDAVIGEN